MAMEYTESNWVTHLIESVCTWMTPLGQLISLVIFTEPLNWLKTNKPLALLTLVSSHLSLCHSLRGHNSTWLPFQQVLCLHPSDLGHSGKHLRTVDGGPLHAVTVVYLTVTGLLV